MKSATVRDLHVYGGALIVATGAGMAHPAAALVVFGAFMVFLGLFWRGPQR